MECREKPQSLGDGAGTGTRRDTVYQTTDPGDEEIGTVYTQTTI